MNITINENKLFDEVLFCKSNNSSSMLLKIKVDQKQTVQEIMGKLNAICNIFGNTLHITVKDHYQVALILFLFNAYDKIIGESYFEFCESIQNDTKGI